MSRARLLALFLLLISLPSFAQQPVGKVDRMVPAGFIARGASTTEAKPADLVEWNDILRTNDDGRMRIALEDGSQLSLGRKSELRVVKHDLASNQTLVEMLYGHVRANVTPIRKTGGSFQVRTPTAVIGVLGTTLEIETTAPVNTTSSSELDKLPTPRRSVSDLANLTPGTMPGGDSQQPTIADFYGVDQTIVRSLDHTVGVRSIDPTIPKTVFLLPGQFTIVRRGLPPTDPQFGNPPQAQECTSSGTCECTGSTCSDGSSLYANPQPEIDRARRPVTTRTGIRSPAICSYETMTLALDNAVTRNSPGNSGGARLDYEINGRGTSTGSVFDVHVKNLTDCPLDLEVPAGLVLKPTGYTERLLKGILVDTGLPPLKDFQLMITEGGFGEVPAQNAAGSPGGFYFLAPGEETTFTVRGYCLELHKLAPHQKTKYKLADQDEQERLAAPNVKVVEAADRMFFTGQGPPPNLAGLDALVQWSLWASREGLTDNKKFEEQYVGLVKRNYEAQKKKFDKQTKEQVEGIAQAFWPYVQKVLEAEK